MSDFENRLQEEMERRGLVEKPEKPPRKKIKLPSIKLPSFGFPSMKNIFSFKAFFKGVFLGLLLLAGLVGWAYYKAPETQQNIADSLPTKTTIVQSDSSELFAMNNETQSVLTMPSTVIPVDEVKDAPPVQQNEEPATPMVAEKGEPLEPAPITGLYRTVPQGLLPIPDTANDLTVFEAYKRPFDSTTTDKPIMSIVVTDAGLSKKQTSTLIQGLPADVTLSFSPYAQNVNTLLAIARADGHEAWMTLPLETKNYPLDDPGPLTLLVNASVEQNNSRLLRLLTAAQGYAGFIAQKNHVFTQENTLTDPTIQDIFSRGLAMVDSEITSQGFVDQLADNKDYPHGKNNFWLDDDLTPLALNQKIRQIINFAEGNGRVVVMLRPYPTSIQALQKFLNSAAADKFTLAPLSAQVKYGE